jgi:hypothetical protein
MSKVHYDQIKDPTKSIPKEDMLEDPCNLDQLSRFLYQVHERLSGGLHYSCYQEQWIVEQIVPNSRAAEYFKLKWDSLAAVHEVNGTACRFSELSNFRDTLLKALYGSENIYQLVTEYVDSLTVSQRNPKAPKNCMDLVLRAERVFSLLGHPLCVDIENQLAVVIKRLPAAVGNAIKIHSLTNPNIKSKYIDLKDFVKVIDDTFAKDLMRKQNKFKATSYKPYNGGSHRNSNSTNQHRGDQQRHNNNTKHNNSMRQDRNSRAARLPSTPFTGTCDHCGMKGHRIRDCRKATDDIKAAWYKQFVERKNNKRKQPDEAKP